MNKIYYVDLEDKYKYAVKYKNKDILSPNKMLSNVLTDTLKCDFNTYSSLLNNSNIVIVREPLYFCYLELLYDLTTNDPLTPIAVSTYDPIFFRQKYFIKLSILNIKQYFIKNQY